LYHLGRYKDAAERLASWLSENRNDSNAMTLMARLYANQGQLPQALLWCEKTLAADKLNAGCHYLRAMILQEHAAAEEAVVSLKRTLYLDPQFVMAHYSLGHLALRQGKAREAERHFANALSVLRTHRSEDLLPESDGITAGRLAEIIQSTLCREAGV
jgi:chemotaxis protein methyltransferase CheR